MPKVSWLAGRLATRRLFGLDGLQDGLIGQALANELDQMKGMSMKVGQILSYFDGVLPEQTHQALRTLQQGTTPMPFPRVRRIVEDAFAEPLEDLFERFDETPVAAPSIGQVHRARLKGQDVAVKVQYPGVAETIDTDFRRLRRIARIASLATAVDGDAIVAELRERFKEECDYTLEASNQAWFQDAFRDDDAIEIPRVHTERTRRNVLTMDWSDGFDLYTFCETGTQERKSEVGLELARFAITSLYAKGRINADPHPGNYLFRHVGPTTFLDFGSVRVFDPDFLEPYRALVQIVIDDDRGAFPQALRETGVVAKEHGFDYELHWEQLRWEHAPYTTPRFRFTPDYVRKGFQYSGPGNPNLRRLHIPPQWIWIQRLQWGLHSVLARLEAEADFATPLRKALRTRPKE